MIAMETTELLNLATVGIAIILTICAFLMMFTTVFTTKR
jgi:hypothetical protein